jgi:RNA polymerase sigma factor (sigma-70 family)
MSACPVVEHYRALPRDCRFGLRRRLNGPSETARLVEGHAKLVALVARTKAPRHVDPDALASAGFAGLLRAAESFDGSRDGAFRRYAWALIWGGMRTHLKRDGRRRERPTDAIGRLAVDDSGDRDPEFPPELLRAVEPLLDRVLTPDERLAVRMRFGFDDGRCWGLDSIAFALGHTTGPHRAGKLIASALGRLREALAGRPHLSLVSQDPSRPITEGNADSAAPSDAHPETRSLPR